MADGMKLFVTRELANDCLGNDLTEVHHADMQELPKNSKDTVLLVKQFIHSTCLSQAPLLALPVGHGGAFNATDLQVLVYTFRPKNRDIYIYTYLYILQYSR